MRPSALIGLIAGHNTGKMLVKLADCALDPEFANPQRGAPQCLTKHSTSNPTATA